MDTVEIDESFYKFAKIIKKHYKLALLSNDSSEWSSYLRDKYKINGFFDVITVSGDVKVKKPDSQIFELTLDKLGCSACECIYVDDREFNLELITMMKTIDIKETQESVKKYYPRK